MNEKCVISGCKLPARGTTKIPFPALEFAVCGVHRRILCETMNKAVDRLHRAHVKVILQFIVDLDELGDHAAERELALAE